MAKHLALLVMVACQAAPSTSPRDPFVAPLYAGVTRCGPVEPPAPRALPPRLPEREPVPSFVAPRDPVPAGDAMPLVEGGLSTDRVSREIARHEPAMRVCYLRRLSHDANAGDFRVQTHFTIVETGTVAGVEIHGTEAVMDRCLCDTFAAMQFPTLDARAVVNYPLIFGRML